MTKAKIGTLCAAVTIAASALLAPPSAQAATVSITSHYDTAAGTFDKSKYLNANEGGYLTHTSLNWLPEAYDGFAGAGLRMVTITHLPNENFYNVVTKGKDDLLYDFSRLDRVVLPLVRHGMTPVMEIGFTPQALGGADRTQGFNNAIPNDNRRWKSVVQNLVQHYADLGYRGWYWEVWNEPSAPNFWKDADVSTYDLMYQATAEGVRAGDPSAKVGGPVVHAPNLAFTNSFLAFLKDNPAVPLDFLSFHEYGGAFDTQGTMAALQNAGRGGTPIFVTEWNSTANMANGPGTSTDINAAYVARQINRAVGKPELAKIFFFSPKEGLTPSQLFNGDLGIMTVDNHRKATYNAVKLYDLMQPTILSTSGTGTDEPVGAIATKDPATGKVTILAWNDQNAATNLTLTLDHLPGTSNLKVTQYLVDATHGNYYADFAAGTRGWDVGPRENADPQESRIVAPTQAFTRTLNLGASAVVAYVLEPTGDAVTDAAQVGPTPIAIGSRDLAFGRPVTSSSSVENWGWSRAALTDGLNHTFPRADNGPAVNGWASAGYPDANHTEWAYVDLGSSMHVDSVKLFPRDDKDCEGYGFPGTVQIQGSNDPNAGWTTLSTSNFAQPLPQPATAQVFSVSGSHRYIRAVGSNLALGCPGVADTNHYFQLAEMQVYGSANQAVSSTVSASSSIQDWGWSTAFVNDGTESTGGAAHGWSSQWGVSTDHPEWIQLDLGSARTISRVDLFPRDDAGNEGKGFPVDVSIQTSPDCATFTTVASRTGQANPGGFRQTLGFAPVNARCVRVYASHLQRLPENGFYLFQLGEIKLYN
ncbi:GH39 family glycosyl hydrolase [Fodinicola acaciae]|uniref:GH39 family glycosyl hydrolase n=1 Tax=Fodinicola acaciae TaxID=2681555 RepID=UPI0013D179CD|nr:discoidin domain-containing protein [Fodinicola acaciae]